MSAFEYVTVLISIILGLGITQILTGVANLYQRLKKVKIYWPHLLWILFVLILHIQEWWVTYELKEYKPWRLPTFLFVMLYPIVLFVMARMLFPKNLKGKSIDLRIFYFKNYRKIFLLFSLAALLSVMHNLFILQFEIQTQILQFLLILTFSAVALKRYHDQWIHKTLAIVTIIILFVSIIIEWNVWLID